MKTNTKFQIGDVVSLKSNGLLPLTKYSFISLGGNENLVTPFMVVVEILTSEHIDIDEESGDFKSTKKGSTKYKCMYFSSKSMKFEDNWFSENEIAIYSVSNDQKSKEEADESKSEDEIAEGQPEIKENSENQNIKWGDTVRFKTVDIEAKKTKSFKEDEQKKGSKSLVTFVAPAMLVVGFSTGDKKEPLIDSHTGKQIRFKSKKMVKCKFFNVDLDKFSEQLVPIECLEMVDNSRLASHLEQISSLINSKDLVIVKAKKMEYFGRPQSVHVYSGRYQMVFYNELTKKNVFLWIDEIESFVNVDNSRGLFYPRTNTGTNEFEDVNKFLDDVMSQSDADNNNLRHLKITYRNFKDVKLTRYITVLIISRKIDNEKALSLENYCYFKSFCHLREAEREFRSDRILSIRTIEDDKLSRLLSEKINQLSNKSK